jgi:hypothetical protein
LKQELFFKALFGALSAVVYSTGKRCFASFAALFPSTAEEIFAIMRIARAERMPVTPVISEISQQHHEPRQDPGIDRAIGTGQASRSSVIANISTLQNYNTILLTERFLPAVGFYCIDTLSIQKM